jgi:hypothetical protein
MFELFKNLTNLFEDICIRNQLGFQIIRQQSYVLGREIDGFPQIPYNKIFFKKIDDPQKYIELFLETIGFYSFPNRVQIKASNEYALNDILSVEFFEYDGMNWRYFPAFDMDAIVNDFENEYHVNSEILQNNKIIEILNCIN